MDNKAPVTGFAFAGGMIRYRPGANGQKKPFIIIPVFLRAVNEIGEERLRTKKLSQKEKALERAFMS